jgi:hypothetical protein
MYLYIIHLKEKDGILPHGELKIQYKILDHLTS